MTTKEEIVDFNDTDEVEEGYPKITSGPYLARATESTVVLGKASGIPYVEYVPVIMESNNEDGGVDRNNVDVRGFKLPKDRIILFANPVYTSGDQEGQLKTPEKLVADDRRMRSLARVVIRNMTGEDFTPVGTRIEVAQEAANALRGATFVAVVGLQPEQNGFPARNIVREHKSEKYWEGN